MTTFLTTIVIIALAMAALGVRLFIKGKPMVRGGCSVHRSPKNGLLGDSASTPPSCSCQSGTRDACPDECSEK